MLDDERSCCWCCCADNKCFYVNSTAALGWEAARNACRSMVLARPADIASITSHQELGEWFTSDGH